MSNQITSIGHIPNEILIDILTALSASTTQKDYLSVLSVSKRWYEAGRASLYHQVVLTSGSSQVALFSRQVSQKALVRSTTYRIDPSHALGLLEHMPTAYVRLAEMTTLLSTLPKLSTISLRQELYDGKNYTFSDDHVAVLLRNLPMTVNSLEIDVLGRYYDDPPQTHLCKIISPLLLRLRHFRLRSVKCCPDLLESFNVESHNNNNPLSNPLVSRLETLILRRDPCGGVSTFRNDPECRSSNRNRYQRTGIEARAHNGTSLPQNLAQELFELRKCGAFPNLRQGVVISRNNRLRSDRPPLIREITPEPYSYKSYKTWDFITNRTITVPFVYNKSDRLIMIRGLDGLDFLGDERSIDNAIEHCSWKEDGRGVRTPLDVTSLDKRDQQRGFRVGPLMDRDTAILRRKVKVPLWHYEAKVGAPIIFARATDGLYDDFSVLEVLPQGWV